MAEQREIKDSEIIDAMESVAMDTGSAAAVLGITRDELLRQIGKRASLRKALPQFTAAGIKKKPSEPEPLKRGSSGNSFADMLKDAVDVPDIQAPVGRTSDGMVGREINGMLGDAIVDSRALGRNLSKMGWDAATQSLALELHDMASQHFKSGLTIMHGGLVHTFLMNLSEQESLKEPVRLVLEAMADVEKYPPGSSERRDLIFELESLHRMVSDTKTSTVKLNEVIHKSSIVQAVMNAVVKDRKKNKHKVSLSKSKP